MADENEETPETPPKPKGTWEKRAFAINGQMKTVIGAAIPATEAQIAQLKRKLRKLQYGS